MQFELDHHLLLEEHDTLTHKLDECQRKCIAIEDEYRSLQDQVKRIKIGPKEPSTSFSIIRNFIMKRN